MEIRNGTKLVAEVPMNHKVTVFESTFLAVPIDGNSPPLCLNMNTGEWVEMKCEKEKVDKIFVERNRFVVYGK